MKPLPIEEARVRVLRRSTRGHGCYWCHALLPPKRGKHAGFCCLSCVHLAREAGLP